MELPELNDSCVLKKKRPSDVINGEDCMGKRR